MIKTFAVAALLFAIFLDMVGFGMVIPDVQTRLEAQGASGAVIGAILSSYFLVQTLISPLWGRISDRMGRKPVLLLCGSLSALSFLAYALALQPVGILLCRILAGFAAANVVVAQAYLADTTKNDASARTALLGRMGAAITAGLVLGPALGGWLSDVGGNRLLGFVAAEASASGVLWLLLAVPHVPPAPPEETSPAVRRRWFPVDLSLLASTPLLRPLLVFATVSFFSLACLEGTFGRLIKHRLGYGPREFGFIFGYEALVGVVTQTLLLDALRKRFSPRRLLCGAYLLQGVGLGLTPFAPNLAALFGLSTLYAVGSGVAGPVLNGLCSDATPKEKQGEMFGLLQSARSLGFLVGPTLGGALFDFRMDAPYLMAGGVMVVAALLIASRKG